MRMGVPKLHQARRRRRPCRSPPRSPSPPLLPRVRSAIPARLEPDQEQVDGDDEDDDGEDGDPPSKKIPPRTPTRVQLPLDREFFASWDDVEAYRVQFGNQTCNKIVVQNTNKTSVRNEVLRNTASALKHGIPPDLIPEDQFPVWRRIFACTHGWRDKKRGTGKRPRQKVLSTGCQWRFQAVVCRHPDGDHPWVIQVRCGFWEHNHPVSLEVYRQHRDSRKIPEWEPVLDDLRLMLRCRGKTVRIYEYIRDKTQYQVKMSDVHNLVVKLRAEERGACDDVAVSDFLLKFQMEHEGNCAAVNETAEGNSGVISFTTHLQRVIFDRFPELLLVDCTHKTNK